MGLISIWNDKTECKSINASRGKSDRQPRLCRADRGEPATSNKLIQSAQKTIYYRSISLIPLQLPVTLCLWVSGPHSWLFWMIIIKLLRLLCFLFSSLLLFTSLYQVQSVDHFILHPKIDKYLNCEEHWRKYLIIDVGQNKLASVQNWLQKMTNRFYLTICNFNEHCRAVLFKMSFWNRKKMMIIFSLLAPSKELTIVSTKDVCTPCVLCLQIPPIVSS